MILFRIIVFFKLHYYWYVKDFERMRVYKAWANEQIVKFEKEFKGME